MKRYDIYGEDGYHGIVEDECKVGEWVRYEDIPEPAIKRELWAFMDWNSDTVSVCLSEPEYRDEYQWWESSEILDVLSIDTFLVFSGDLEINPGELYHYTPETGWEKECE